MTYRFKISKKAKKDIAQLEPIIQRRIIKKLRTLQAEENPLRHAKKLTNPTLGTHRFRIGDYRALADVKKNGEIIILFLRIKHRKSIYTL